MRRILVLAGLVAAVAAPGGLPSASAEGCRGTPTSPEARYLRFVPKAPGTEVAYCLFYGPYVIPPGHDLSRVDLDLALAGGFVVAGAPSVVYADGTEPSHQVMHLHHSHWWLIQPDRDSYPLPWMTWLSGSGEELTRADFREVAGQEPGGPGYGLYIPRGGRVVMVNMLHNKSASPQVVWIKVDLVFVHGTPEEIQAATGRAYHNLTGVLVGGTFDAPRGSGVGGKLTYPRDLPAVSPDPCAVTSSPPEGVDVPGCGRVWVAPFDGTIVLAGAHLHPGGERVVVKNLGSVAEPCPSDGNLGIPGTTLYELDLLDRRGAEGARFTEDFQIEITKPGFRAALRAGDRIVVNGIYDTAEHAWWEAMSFTGFYVDEARTLPRCSVADLEGGDPVEGMPNRAWEGAPDPLCGPGLGGPCDRNLPPPPRGAVTDQVVISGFTYTPGDLNLSEGLSTTPLVKRGTPLRFVNADIAHYVRHTVTSCALPCDGPYVANYPLPDGTFDSRYLGWEPTTGGRQLPTWTLDTAPLAFGRYTYFCRVHPWMRGTFEVVP